MQRHAAVPVPSHKNTAHTKGLTPETIYSHRGKSPSVFWLVVFLIWLQRPVTQTDTCTHNLREQVPGTSPFNNSNKFEFAGQVWICGASTNWKSLKHIYLKRVLLLLFVHNCFHGNPPVPLTDLFNKRTPNYNLQQKMCVLLPRPRSEFLKKSLAYQGAILWNFK